MTRIRRASGAAPFGALLVGLAAAAAGAQDAPGARPSTGESRLDGVAAVVQGEPIFESEVEEQFYLFLLQSGLRPDSAGQAALRGEILGRLIDEKLIVQEAQRQNVTVDESDIEAQVTQAIEDAKERLGGEAAYRAELVREGISEEELRERYRVEIRRQMLANQLLRRQLDTTQEIGPTEAERFYRENQGEFPRKPPEVRVAVIQVTTEPDPDERAKGRRRAEAVLARLGTGEPFARLAQELSEDPATKNAGGDLGYFERGKLDSTFEAAAWALEPGQVSGVVETPFGFHVIKLEDKDTEKNELHARHILIRVQPGPDDQRRAREAAERVRSEAAKGTDFAVLVRRYSKYRGPQGEGGDLGFIPLNEFAPNIAGALDTLETGEVSPVLTSPQGFVIFKMIDRRPERAFRVEEIREQLPELVRQVRLRRQYDRWVASLREKAQVEIK